MTALQLIRDQFYPKLILSGQPDKIFQGYLLSTLCALSMAALVFILIDAARRCLGTPTPPPAVVQPACAFRPRRSSAYTRRHGACISPIRIAAARQRLQHGGTMRTHQLSILALCIAAGCAHGKSGTEAARQEGESQQRAAAETAGEARASAEERMEAGEERVEIPSPRRRGEMASAGDELPAQRDKDKAGSETPTSAAYGTDPDNTRVNERDRGSSALTPMDQSEADTDRDITQRIRKAVIANESLSFTAKNVKIITRDGHVTLRGTVNTAGERSAIEQAARSVAGPTHVTSEIEVSD